MVALYSPYLLADLFQFGSLPFQSPCDALTYLRFAARTHDPFPNLGRELTIGFARLWDQEGRPYVVDTGSGDGVEQWVPDREYEGEGAWEL